jgi:hypothetical protein
MGLQSRTASCDICGKNQSEERFGSGWAGWAIIQGIAAVEPKEGVPLDNTNMETYVCPDHIEELSVYLTLLQEKHS